MTVSHLKSLQRQPLKGNYYFLYKIYINGYNNLLELKKWKLEMLKNETPRNGENYIFYTTKPMAPYNRASVFCDKNLLKFCGKWSISACNWQIVLDLPESHLLNTNELIALITDSMHRYES